VALTLEAKKKIVAEVTEQAAIAQAAVLADYRGLTVTELTELRVQARNANVFLRVVPNNLMRRAVKDTELACLDEALVGPNIFAFSRGEPGSAARVIRDFAKTHEKLEVRALSIGGKLMGPESLKAMAELPTKDEAIASLMSVMQAPITKFVRTLAEPHAKLVRTVAAIRDKKQAES
jgi:large subunit ribosomal protein L10